MGTLKDLPQRDQVSPDCPSDHDMQLKSGSIVGSFAQVFCFPRAVELLDSKKIRTDGMVTDIFSLQDYQKALDKLASRNALKIAIKP